MDSLELKILPNGTTLATYRDGVEKLLDAEIVTVKRASLVEWEGKGWTVRAAIDPELAIRHSVDGLTVSKEGELAVFPTREEALTHELEKFWQLLGDPDEHRKV